MAGRELSAADEPIRYADRCLHARSAVAGRPPRAAARHERCRARRSAAEPALIQYGSIRQRSEPHARIMHGSLASTVVPMHPQLLLAQR